MQCYLSKHQLFLSLPSVSCIAIMLLDFFLYCLAVELNLFLIFAIFLSTATIYDDGTNKIMLKFAFDQKMPSFTTGRELLGVSYAKMYPVRSSFELPATERIGAVGKIVLFTYV